MDCIAAAIPLIEQATAVGFCKLCGLADLSVAYEQVGQRDSAIAVAERYANGFSANRIFTDARDLAPTLFRLGELFDLEYDLLLYDAKDFITLTPARALWPGLAISLTVLSVNYMGDGLRDALDPRARAADSA